MKNLLTLICMITLLSACEKKEPVGPAPEPAPAPDQTAPVITVRGNVQDTINFMVPYNDLGAVAVDNVDGDISAKIAVTGTVNSQVPADYLIQYQVKDQAGNAAPTATRTVHVRSAAIMPGNYLVSCSSSTHNPGVDPTVYDNNNYASVLSLSAGNSTLFSLSAFNIGPLTGPTNPLGISGTVISGNNLMQSAPGKVQASVTGTMSPSKTSFTIDSKFYENTYPNKYYEARNVFTRQ